MEGRRALQATSFLVLANEYALEAATPSHQQQQDEDNATMVVVRQQPQKGPSTTRLVQRPPNASIGVGAMVAIGTTGMTQRRATPASNKEGMATLKAMDREAIDYNGLSVAQIEELVPERAVRRKERDSLLLFAQAVGDATWHEKKGWVIDGRDIMVEGVSRWTGITTSDMENGAVTQLELPNNNLRGFISPHLEYLKKLRIICLRSNQLVGPIPEAIAPGKVLVELDLSSNRLTGPIPESIFESRFLTKLNLSKNSLTGAIPPTIGQLASLKHLFLDFNALSGPWPIELLVLLEHLEAYRFRANEFSFKAMTDEDAAMLDRTTSIVASDCGLSGEIPSRLIALSGRLERFSLQMNDGLSLPSDVEPLVRGGITVLELAMHDLVGPLPKSWGRLDQVRILKLQMNQLSGNIPSALGDMASLEHLDLSANQLTGDVPLSFSRLTSLQELRLSRNSLDGVLPEGISRLTKLQVLAVDENGGLYGTLPDSWQSLTGLTELNLAHNKFSGPMPRALEGILGLRILSLNNNAFNRAIPKSLSNCRRLEYLYLHENRFTGKFPRCMARLTALKDCSFYGNQLEGPYPSYDDFRDHILHTSDSTTGPPESHGKEDEDDDDVASSARCVFARHLVMVYVPKTNKSRSRTCVLS